MQIFHNRPIRQPANVGLTDSWTTEKKRYQPFPNPRYQQIRLVPNQNKTLPLLSPAPFRHHSITAPVITLTHSHTDTNTPRASSRFPDFLSENWSVIASRRSRRARGWNADTPGLGRQRITPTAFTGKAKRGRIRVVRSQTVSVDWGKTRNEQ